MHGFPVPTPRWTGTSAAPSSGLGGPHAGGDGTAPGRGTSRPGKRNLRGKQAGPRTSQPNALGRSGRDVRNLLKLRGWSHF